MLTTAHCVRDHIPVDLSAVTIAGQRRTYTRFAMHPNWRHVNGSGNYLDDVAIVELSAPATGVPTVQLGSSAEPKEAWILGRGRAYAPGTGHTETGTLDASLRMAPLRSLRNLSLMRRHPTVMLGARPPCPSRPTSSSGAPPSWWRWNER